MDCAATPSAEAAIGKPRRRLVAGAVVVGVLRNPKRMIRCNLRPIFFGANAAAHVDDAANAGLIVDVIEELLCLVGSDAPVHLIIENGNAVAEVVTAACDEMLSLSDGVFSVHEVIEAPELAELDSLLNPRIAGVVNDGSSLGRLADNEIARHLRKVKPSLVVRNINAVECHRNHL